MAETRTVDRIRETFVARFGEDQAHLIEDAAQEHYAENEATLSVDALAILGHALPSPHATDDFGSSPFRYWFLLAIGRECVTRFREYHGITAAEADMRKWALTEGELAEHDGSIPDFIAIFAGRYDGWVAEEEE